MIQERIGEVRVRVRADSGDAAEIRPAAERMVRAVLERCAALLEERWPGRLVFIRRLPLSWRMEGPELDDPSRIEDHARAAADAIERISRPPVLDPPASAEGAVIFDDEAHLRASHLLALARDGPGWFHADLEAPSDPLAALAAPERRDIVQATLARLAREGVLAEVLAARPAPAVAVFAAALGCDPGGAGEESDMRASTTPGPSMAVELAAIASRWPPLTGAARSLALRVHASLLLDARLESPAAVALAGAVLRSGPQVADTNTVNPPAVAPDKESPEPAATAAKESRELDAARYLEPSQPAPEPQSSSGEFVSTRCAGLFYLLDRLQELDLAESLWKACLPEGGVLAAAAAALLGPGFSEDPAPSLFGGVDRAAPCPQVSLEQFAEIAVNTTAALASALPRRGLAVVPPVTVTLVDRPTGRLLVAAADHSPFAFFAWPADTSTVLSAGLRALLETWPHHGVLSASPELAAVDTTGRLRPSRSGRSAWLLPDATSAPAAALLSLVMGAPCLLFAARSAAGPFDSSAAFVTRFLERPGRIRVRPGEMEIIFRGDDLDLTVRRAALDRDPGWLPWLRRTVRFVFEEQRYGSGEAI